MRLHIGSVLALLAYSYSAQASWPQHYPRQNQQGTYLENGTYVPQRLPVATPTNYNTTSVTYTYAFVPESHSSTTTSQPTVEVISSLVVISTYTKTTSFELRPTEDASYTEEVPYTESVNSTSTAVRLPYPISGRPSQSYVVPGNGTFPTAPPPPLSATQTSETSRVSRRPKVWIPKPGNDTCGGATLNVVDAHLDYWYTETYTHTISTLSVQFNANDSQTGWTMLPATTEFDISTAIKQNTCGATATTLNTQYNMTITDWACYTTPTPVASSTTVLSVDAYKPINQTTGNGTSIPNIATEPPKAVATLPSAAGTYTEGTPFVYFSEFEIESSQPTTLPNGSEGCAINTRMLLLNRLFSFAFDGEDQELSQMSLTGEDASGEIDPEFLRLVGEGESVTAGTWNAEPTVIVVVERGVVAQAVLAEYTTARQGGPLITPTPTLPDFLSSIDPTSPAAPQTYYSPRVEETANNLDVPAGTTIKPFNIGRLKTFVAHIEHTVTTLVLPEPTDTDVITTNIGGQDVTATAMSNVMADVGDGSDNNGGSSNSNGNGNGNGNSGNSNSDGDSSSGNGNGNGNDGNNNNANDNDEGSWIMMPFVAHIENSAVTLDVAAPATAKVVTAAFDGKTLTATALSAVETGAGSANNNGGNSGSGLSNGGSSNGNSNGGGSGNGDSNNRGSGNGNSNSGGSGNDNSNNGGSSNGGSNSGSSNTGSNNDGSSNSNSNNAGSSNGGSNNGGSSNVNNNNDNNNDNNDNNSNGAGGVWGNLVSKIAAAAKPTNAAEVLSQAMGNGHNDATAAAIAAGIGELAAGAAVDEAHSGSGASGNGQVGSNAGSDSDSNAGSFSSGSDTGSLSGSDSDSGSDSGSASGNYAGSNAGSGFGSESGSNTGSNTGSDTGSNSGSDSGSSSGSNFGISGSGNGGSGSNPESINGPNGHSSVQPERIGASPGQVITVDGATFTASPAHAFVVEGQTVVPGGTPITVDGTVIFVPASTNAVVVDGTTRALSGDFAAATALDINGMEITAQPGVGFPISGQTLQAGGPAITVDGTRLSLAPGGTAIVIGSSTSAIVAAARAASEIPEVTIGSQTFTANAATQFFLAPGQTLTPGGTAVVSGTTVSLDASASAVVVNGQTLSFGSSPAATITPSPEIIHVNGQAFVPNNGGTYVISGQTLTPGGSIIVTGANGAETLSLASSGNELVAVVSGHSITSTLDAAAAADATAAPIITIGGQTFTALPGTDGSNPTYLVNGELLTAGQGETVTIGGKTYAVSLSPQATLLEIEELGSNGKATRTQLQTLFPATATGRTPTMTAPGGSTSSDARSSIGGSDDEQSTGVNTAAPAQETGAATLSTGAVQLTSCIVAAGTLLFAVLL